MGLFGSSAERKPFNIESAFWILFIALLGVQAIGLVFGKAIGFSVQLGPVFLLFASMIAVYFGFGIARNKWNGFLTDKKDAIVFVLFVAFVVFLYIMLPKVAPEIFKGAAQQLQSIVFP